MPMKDDSPPNTKMPIVGGQVRVLWHHSGIMEGGISSNTDLYTGLRRLTTRLFGRGERMNGLGSLVSDI